MRQRGEGMAGYLIALGVAAALLEVRLRETRADPEEAARAALSGTPLLPPRDLSASAVRCGFVEAWLP
jgi:hypothetical protein